MSGLTLITATCDRPEALRICETLMSRQTILDQTGPQIQWVVADGGQTPVVCGLGQDHVRVPYSPDPKLSFLANVSAAVRAAEFDRVVIIEDDDWYSPHWLMLCWNAFERGVELFGEADARYYNVRTRRHWRCGNRGHASLCSTAYQGAAVREWLLHRLATHQSTFVDMHMWKQFSTVGELLHPSNHVVGIKGVPGRAGIGIGHRLGSDRPHDADGSVLRSWVGRDADLYFQFAEGE